MVLFLFCAGYIVFKITNKVVDIIVNSSEDTKHVTC